MTLNVHVPPGVVPDEADICQDPRDVGQGLARIAALTSQIARRHGGADGLVVGGVQVSLQPTRHDLAELAGQLQLHAPVALAPAIVISREALAVAARKDDVREVLLARIPGRTLQH
jgi:hypothetical protein